LIFQAIQVTTHLPTVFLHGIELLVGRQCWYHKTEMQLLSEHATDNMLSNLQLSIKQCITMYEPYAEM